MASGRFFFFPFWKNIFTPRASHIPSKLSSTEICPLTQESLLLTWRYFQSWIGGGMLRLEEWTRICRISNMQFHFKLVFPGFLSLSLTIEPGANSVSSLNLSSSLNLEWYIYQTDVLSGLVMLGTQRHAECQPPESGMNMCLSISGSRKKRQNRCTNTNSNKPWKYRYLEAEI